MEHNFSHVSVLLYECIDALNIKPDGIYVDCTLGGGGHSLEIVKKLDTGKLICIDQDICAIEAASARLAEYKDKIIFVKNNFSNFGAILDELGIEKVDGALLDLGVSSYQLDTAERGFSYHADAPLDMRMDQDQALTAADIVNTWSKQEITQILRDYAEEKWAARIADIIIEHRAVKPLETTADLVACVDAAIPKKIRMQDSGHSARRTFQALRIAVNDELEPLHKALEDMAELLNPGGQLAVITFHSLEDRIVKTAMAAASKGCTCPPNFPVCVCGKKPQVKLVNKKPIVSGEEELDRNPRARSAKLRVCEKL